MQISVRCSKCKRLYDSDKWCICSEIISGEGKRAVRCAICGVLCISGTRHRCKGLLKGEKSKRTDYKR